MKSQPARFLPDLCPQAKGEPGARIARRQASRWWGVGASHRGITWRLWVGRSPSQRAHHSLDMLALCFILDLVGSCTFDCCWHASGFNVQLTTHTSDFFFFKLDFHITQPSYVGISQILHWHIESGSVNMFLKSCPCSVFHTPLVTTALLPTKNH